MLDKQIEVQKAMSQHRMAEALFSAVMAKFTDGASSPAGQSVLLNNTMRLFHSFTPEQFKKLFELLTQDQQVLLVDIVEQAQKIAPGQGGPGPESDPTVNGVEAAAAAAAAANAKNAKNGS